MPGDVLDPTARNRARSSQRLSETPHRERLRPLQVDMSAADAAQQKEIIPCQTRSQSRIRPPNSWSPQHPLPWPAPRCGPGAVSIAVITACSMKSSADPPKEVHHE